MESPASELKQLQGSFIRYMVSFLGIFITLLVLTTTECRFFDTEFTCLLPGTPSLASELFQAAQSFLVPQDVPVVALTPISVFLAPLSLSFLMALLVTFPYGVYLLLKFLLPALRVHERKAIYALVLPSLLLFYFGVAFAYFLIIPKTFAVLYSFAIPLGITPLFSLNEFLATTVLITVATGFSFLLPVGMVLLSRLGLVEPAFWSNHWRGSILATLIFSAIITPDGSGITMVFLSLPLIFLYCAGIIFSRPSVV